jgi:solute carrier family 25 (mitochondrial carnitine/acylcarnitine transporter), member 20/29
VCIGHPLDLVKVRQQMSHTTITNTSTVLVSNHGTTMFMQPRSTAPLSTYRILSTIVRNDGYQGLYAGVSAPLAAVIPAFAISFASYEFAKNRIQHNNHDPSKSLSITQSACAGAFSGIPLAFVVGPTERIKCLMQLYPKDSKYSTFGRAIVNVYSEGGLTSICRGTFMTVCRDVPGNAAYFATYEYIKRVSTNHLNNGHYDLSTRSQMTVLSTMFAGGMAGVANWIVAIPIDVVKSRWQASEPGRYANVRSVVRHLYQTQGVTAFFSGLTPALLRAFPANAGCFLAADTVKRWLVPDSYRDS